MKNTTHLFGMAAAILEALRQIQGFSPCWGFAARWLAKQQTLTPHEAAIGQRIVYHHRTQIPLGLLAAALGNRTLTDLKGAMRRRRF